ncbi:MAG: hypothetical protein WBY66_19770, partial [Candidatus Acidiferrales bacterium]
GGGIGVGNESEGVAVRGAGELNEIGPLAAATAGGGEAVMKEGAANVTELPKFVCAPAVRAKNKRPPAKTEIYFIVYFPQTKECSPAY